MKFEAGKENMLYALAVGLAGWLVPGCGHLLLGQKLRAIIIFIAITALFVLGLYVGSIGVIDPVNATPWYVGQLFTSPFVAVIGKLNTPISGIEAPYWSSGKPFDIGQIYTTIAGMLNLLCMVDVIYQAYRGKQMPSGE